MLFKIDFGQLTTYPFDAGIWGTFSDWVIIILTGITAWYLIKTFKEQRKINDDQATINRILIKQYLKSIRPYFVFGQANSGKVSEYSITLKGANAKSLSIKNVFNGDEKISLDFLHQESELSDYFTKTSGVISYDLNGFLTRFVCLGKIEPTELDVNKQIDLVIIDYSDEDDNEYFQTMYYKAGDIYFAEPKFKL